MKKYFTFFLLSVVFSVVLFSQTSFTNIGEGTAENPYEIWTKFHFDELRDSTYNSGYPNFSDWHYRKYFRLMQDIENVFDGLSWWRGYFYGNEKTITVTIDVIDPMHQVSSLFPIVSETVSNLIVYGSVVSNALDNIGLAGISIINETYNLSEINNCINNTTVISENTMNGYGTSGIVRDNRGTISHCINNGNVSGADLIAGIASVNNYIIKNCINTGKITASNSGNITPYGAYGSGGIASSSGYITNCINIGDIIGQNNVGGISGIAIDLSGDGFPITMSNCINAGFIKGDTLVGGIVGKNFYTSYFSSGVLRNCVNIGVIEGEEDVGGIVGKE